MSKETEFTILRLENGWWKLKRSDIPNCTVRIETLLGVLKYLIEWELNRAQEDQGHER